MRTVSLPPFFAKQRPTLAFLKEKLPELLHPLSGVVILGLDWLLFSGTVFTLGLSTPATSTLGFVAGTVSIAWLQTTYTDDSRRRSLFKGVLAGIAIGLPLPIAGTGAGGLVLALSGLNRLRGSDSASSDKLDSEQ